MRLAIALGILLATTAVANAGGNSNNSTNNANVNANTNNNAALSGSASSARSNSHSTGGSASADSGGNDAYVFSPVQPPSIAPGGELSVCYSLSLAVIGGGYCGPHEELLNDVRFQRFLLARPTQAQVVEYITRLDDDARAILNGEVDTVGRSEQPYRDGAGRDLYGRDTF